RPAWLVAWNAAYDAEILTRVTGWPFNTVIARMIDTGALAGLHDPRAKYQGGVGRGLKEWAEYVQGKGASSVEAQRKALFPKPKVDWSTVDSWDPVMVRYAGSDPILTYRVHRHLVALTRARALEAVYREQAVMRAVARMRHRGLAIDVERAEAVRVEYRTE